MTHVIVRDKYRITIPKAIREKLGIRPGQKVEMTASGGSIRIDPRDKGDRDERVAGSRDGEASEVATPPVEVYSPERIAEFLLSNAVDADDYAEAVEEVRKMGLDPDSIPHEKPV